MHCPGATHRPFRQAGRHTAAIGNAKYNDCQFNVTHIY